GRLWGGLWEFPTIHIAGADPAGRAFSEPVDLAEGIHRLTGVHAEIGPIVRTLRFGVTHHRVHLDVHSAIGLTGDAEPGPGLTRVIWEWPRSLVDYSFGIAGRRLAAWLAEGSLASTSREDPSDDG